MANDNYENLGFQVNVDGADSAVSHLDKIVERFKNLDKETIKLEKSQIRLENAYKSVLKAEISLASAQGTHEVNQRNLEKALNNLEVAQSNYDKLLEKPYYTQYELIRKENALANARLSVENAQTRLYQSEERVNSARETYEQRVNSLQSAELSHAQVIMDINQEREKEKQNLSEIEKYLKKVNDEKDFLNDKSYEEARAIELANQKRKKEIDQRLKQSLGIKENTKSLSKYLVKLASSLALARKAGHFIKGIIEEQAKYTENLVLFKVAFGNTSKQQLDWALGIADAYGLARNEVVKFAGTFRELSESLGLVGETADTVTETVTKLGYDLSALYNTSVENAMEKLQSGVFTGQTKPLRSFGIDSSQQQIDALFETNEALAGLGVNARNLSQADKTLSRLIITLNSGKDSFGTMAIEINNLQSQIRIFQGSLSNLKLALGNFVEEPIRRVLVYLNAFIIGVTDVINAFAPKRQEDTAFDKTTEGAEEANEAIDELNGKLADFDKFNVLGGQSSGAGSNISVTEELNKLLAEQAQIYDNEVAKAMNKVKNEAVELAKKVKDFFIVVDDKGQFVEWTTQAQLLWRALLLPFAALIALKIKAKISQKEYTKALVAHTAALKANTEALKQNANNMQSMNKSVEKTTKSITAMEVATATLSIAFAVGGLTKLWSSEASAGEKLTHTFVGLAAAIGAAAIAMSAFKQNWVQALEIAGTVAGGYYSIAALANTQGFADGGYTNANLIMTHENGKREWVGKAACSSAIVNDTQMSDIMEIAVAKGVYNALSARSAMGSNAPTNETIVVQIGEEAVFNAVRKTARKQGRDIPMI